MQFIGVYLTGVHLIGVLLTGVRLVGVYLTIGLYLNERAYRGLLMLTPRAPGTALRKFKDEARKRRWVPNKRYLLPPGAWRLEELI
jgi:hypothetical protein